MAEKNKFSAVHGAEYLVFVNGEWLDAIYYEDKDEYSANMEIEDQEVEKIVPVAFLDCYDDTREILTTLLDILSDCKNGRTSPYHIDKNVATIKSILGRME